MLFLLMWIFLLYNKYSDIINKHKFKGISFNAFQI